MIVTGSAPQQHGHVILQADHADLAHQLARAFGNATFQPLEPRVEMEFLSLNHDRGWDAIDKHISRNPVTGLPYSLVSTPIDELLASGPQSVSFNTAHHPYCGLLAAMHVWGLFNGRYGLSDKVVVNLLQGEARKKADIMLGRIHEQLCAIKAALSQDPVYSTYVAEPVLMRNYKLLQLFDTMSLYFNEHPFVDGEATHFLNVPVSTAEDVTLRLRPLGDKTYQVSPYPFGAKELVLTQKVYEVPVLNIDVDYTKVLAESPCYNQTIRVVS